MVIKCSIFYIILVFLLQCSCNARRFGSTISSFRAILPLDCKGDEKLRWDMNLGPNVRDTNGNGMVYKDTIKRIVDAENPCIKGNEATTKGTRIWRRVVYRKRVLHSLILSNEGFMETDYQPPHRKSPIHNK